MPESKSKKSARLVDLDELRAARLEKAGVGPQVKLGGKQFQCPAEIPFSVVEAFARVDSSQKAGDNEKLVEALYDVIRGLFGPQYDDFMSLQPSIEDLTALVENVLSEYGMTEGESEASASS